MLRKINQTSLQIRRTSPRCALLTLAFAVLSCTLNATSQTLARPGWAGSGMKLERWWPNAVLCEVTPDSLASTSSADGTFHRVEVHLEDLQTLGIDAILLRGLEPATPSAAISIDPRYGTLENLDQFVSDTVHHGMRVLVELRPNTHGPDLTNDARFWLSHGVTGLLLPTSDPTDLRQVRAVLHTYVGERILIAPPSETSRENHPELVQLVLPPISAGAAPLRSALEHERSPNTPIPLFTPSAEVQSPLAARPLATILLGSGGAALLHADDLDLDHAGDPTSKGSTFAWYRQWSGLHRGNLLSGTDTLLNYDAEGALVWVRQPPGSGQPIVFLCNLTAQPLHLSLVDDLHKLRLRGSFLRTLTRSDSGMGAMPLRSVTLQPFGVYVGLLSF